MNTVTLDKPLTLSEPQFLHEIKIVLDPCHRAVVTVSAHYNVRTIEVIWPLTNMD